MVRFQPSRQFFARALAVILAGASTVITPAQATAAELRDYLWQSRPLLVFAPTDSDPRLVKTMRRIEATRCDFADRDMVLGRILAEGTSTLDGHVVDTTQAQRLASQFGIGARGFSVVLIGKDGGRNCASTTFPIFGRSMR